MLAIEIRFLNGWYLAKEYSSAHERAEWPPHPDRIFMAMAAAYFETERDAAEREALEWLETRPSPQLCVPAGASRRDVLTTYVPVNDDASPGIWNQKKQTFKPHQEIQGVALGRNRQPRRFPAVVPDDPFVMLLWPDAEPSDAQRMVLERLCRKVTYVGHSASLVQMWVEPAGAEAAPRPTLVPGDRAARHRLRVFGRGRLAHLEACYNETEVLQWAQLKHRVACAKGKRRKDLKEELERRFPVEPRSQRPTPVMWRGYDRPVPTPAAPALAHTVFTEHVLILRRIEGPVLGLESTLQIAQALRDTVMRAGPQPPPEWISGHRSDGERSEQPHLACIPLAHVGREHADGHLLGVALVVPRDIAAEDRRHCLRDLLFDEFGELRTIRLTLGRLGVWQLRLEEAEARPVALRPETWTAAIPRRGARRWATVTPVVLDRHPKAKEPSEYWRGAETIVRASCERVLACTPEAPRVEEVILTPVSTFEGVPHARRFPNLQRKTGGNLHHTHAIIVFDRPVVGPLLIGAGRYRGYGLGRPLDGPGEASE